MSDSEKLQPFLAEAHAILMESFGEYLGSDPLGHFDVSDNTKSLLIPGSDLLGSFDAWTDRVSLNILHDPLGTAVHELLHANSFSDDWLPEDTGLSDDILCFRGFEIQRIARDRRRVKAIHHRGLNEAVTELLTMHAYRKAIPAYVDLLVFAKELGDSIGFDSLVREYFCDGYPGLEDVANKKSYSLSGLETRMEGVFRY